MLQILRRDPLHRYALGFVRPRRNLVQILHRHASLIKFREETMPSPKWGDEGVAHSNQFELQELIQNDRNYFRAGCKTLRRPTYEIKYLPGQAHSAAGCMVEFNAVRRQDLFQLVNDLDKVRAQTVRTYLAFDVIDPILERLGFQRSIENGMLIRPTNPVTPYPRGISIREATKSDDEIKIQLYDEDQKRPDGKYAAASEFVAIERCKIDSGYMKGFIVEHMKSPIGCFGLSIEGEIVRMKNLMVRASSRGLGGGASIVRFAQRYCIANGCNSVGVFAIENSPGERLYSKEGMQIIGAQTEYALPYASLRQSLLNARTEIA